jgi:hypothetical protein
MRCRSYQDPGVTPLLVAAFHLRDLARIEFKYGNTEEGLFLSQLALDLRRIANGGPLNCTAIWRTFAAQHPTLFTRPARRETLTV